MGAATSAKRSAVAPGPAVAATAAAAATNATATNATAATAAAAAGRRRHRSRGLFVRCCNDCALRRCSCRGNGCTAERGGE